MFHPVWVEPRRRPHVGRLLQQPTVACGGAALLWASCVPAPAPAPCFCAACVPAPTPNYDLM